MTASDYNSMKQQLLSRVIAGEITRDEYDQLLAEIGRQESSNAGDTFSVAQQDTDGEAAETPRRVARPAHGSVGDMATGSVEDRELSAGEKVDNFKLLKRLGRGGMGEVWKARDTVGERDVVLKVLPSELMGSEKEIARIKKSFQHVQALNHEHICPTYSLGKGRQAGYYLVMKYLEGGTLSWYREAVVKKYGKLPFKPIVYMLTRIAEPLDYATGKR